MRCTHPGRDREQQVGVRLDGEVIRSVDRIKGAATSRKKKISKKYNIGVVDLKFTQYIPIMVSDIVYKWKSDQTSMTSLWRHYDVIRPHDVNDWDRDMKFSLVEFEVIANKRPPRFLWLSSPIMKYEVLILPTGKNLDFSWFLHIKTCFRCNKSVTFHVIKN